MTIRVRVCQAPTCTCTYWWMVNKHLLARVHTIEMPVEKHVSYVASTYNLWIYWIWLCIVHALTMCWFPKLELSHTDRTHSKDTFGESKKKRETTYFMIMWAILSKYCGKREMQQCIISVCVCVCGVFRIREIRNAIQNNFHDISNALFFRRRRRSRRCPDCCCAHMST